MDETTADPEEDDTAPEADDGLKAFLLVASHTLGEQVDTAIVHAAKRDPDGPFSPDDFVRAGQRLGLKVRKVRTSPSRLPYQPVPALARMRDGSYTVLLEVENGVRILDLETRRGEVVADEDFLALWDGTLICFARRITVSAGSIRFNLGWFLTSIKKYRRPFVSIIIFSFVIQLAAFVTPMFFQVVIDKVIIHRAESSLQVLAVGLFLVYFFEVLLTGLRGYLLPHTTNRIDVELGSRMFQHLLKLPQSYFDARRVGDTVARVRELENIRNFMTSSALTIAVDAFFAVALISILFFYNTMLAWIVVAALPVYILLSLLAFPRYVKLLEEKFNRGANNQAFLVETVTAMGTLKAMAVAPAIQRRWDDQLAGYVSASFKTTTLANWIDQIALFTSKIVQLCILWLGAGAVMAGRMTVGELVAFNMLASQVSQPILKLVHMWKDFQQAKVSVDRLGDVLNSPIERPIADKSIPMPPVQGHIRFDNVSFRYATSRADVLTDLNLDIEAGTFIGIVGSSGSGKSTMTKLIQLLYAPTRGRILIDDMDLAVIEPDSLRRQIGVVLQDNILFNCSVAENIGYGHPEITFDRIIRAAQLAGAHDFIVELASGYNTIIGERGTSLSGGQRQRIAIARALVTDPRILIFDEATSALDYESEQIIQSNMEAICEGRTVVVIAHRLSAVRIADRIITMENGEIVESGTHEELLEAGGRYAQLHDIQAGQME